MTISSVPMRPRAVGSPPVGISARRGEVARISRIALCTLILGSLGAFEASAETISGALAKAYGFSPDLGQQRAATRAADEGVPKATGSFRPTITGTTSVGVANTIITNPLSGGKLVNGTLQSHENFLTVPRVFSLAATQTLYNGNRAVNGVRSAESTVLQSREQLRLSELNILNAAAAAYMNVLRDTALLQLNESNIQVLQQQLKQTNDRYQVGEVTRTDVAQAQAALSLGQATAFTARSNLQNSLGIYRQLVGEPPNNLSPARAIEALLPKSLDQAITLSQSEHPAIQAALHAVDVAALNVKVQEGALHPTVSVTGSVSESMDAANTPKYNLYQAAAIGTISVPIYDGGVTYANVRQAKEQLGQARLQADLQRETVRSTVVSAWGAYQNTKASIQSFQASVKANEVALAGIREEAKVGQRTTLDVLNAQQTLLNSRTSLVTAQRDQVVNSYALSAAVGQLTAARLGLGVEQYDPTVHFDQVKDKVFGVRTPDGR